MRSSGLLCTWCAILAAVLVACVDPPPPETIDRESFVQAYVALRTAALQRGAASVDGPVRDTVLRESGVTEEELLTFAEVHGEDFTFMQSIWTEVSTQLEEVTFRPLAADTVDAR